MSGPMLGLAQPALGHLREPCAHVGSYVGLCQTEKCNVTLPCLGETGKVKAICGKNAHVKVPIFRYRFSGLWVVRFLGVGAGCEGWLGVLGRGWGELGGFLRAWVPCAHVGSYVGLCQTDEGSFVGAWCACRGLCRVRPNRCRVLCECLDCMSDPMSG